MNTDTVKRFWAKIKKADNGCWNWTASKRPKGYGAFVWATDTGKIIQGSAHRFSYELHYGVFDTILCVLHRCDNPACVNPQHLFLGTRKDNNLDMVSKGRHRSGASKTPVNQCKYKRGDEHHAFKFPAFLIKKIRADRAKGMSYGKISKQYTVAIGYAFRICNGTARRSK